jgi:hypothetical protein
MSKVDNFFKNKKKNNSQTDASADSKEKKQTKKPVSWKMMVMVLEIIIFLGSLGSTGYFYYKYKKVINNPAAVSQDEAKSITEKIRKFMDLPDEQPTLATVADREKLKDQMFFSSAQNGDKVLIFPKNQKAVLYRPSTDRVIEVTSLIGGSAAPAPAPSVQANTTEPQSPPQETQPAENNPQEGSPPEENSEEIKKASVTVYNGANIAGLAKNIAEQISDIEGVEVVSMENAEGNYKKNIVIDLAGSNLEIAQKIADKIGGEIGELPSGEKKPETDILIIGGKK